MNRVMMKERLINLAADHFVGMALSGLPESAAREFRKTALARIETILDELFSIDGRESLFKRWIEDVLTIRVIGHEGNSPVHALFMGDSILGSSRFSTLGEAQNSRREYVEHFVFKYNVFIEKKKGADEG